MYANVYFVFSQGNNDTENVRITCTCVTGYIGNGSFCEPIGLSHGGLKKHPKSQKVKGPVIIIIITILTRVDNLLARNLIYKLRKTTCAKFL